MSETTLNVIILSSKFSIKSYFYLIHSFISTHNFTSTWFVIDMQNMQHFQVSNNLQMPTCYWMRLIQNVNFQSMIKTFNKTSCSSHNLNQLLSLIIFQFFMATLITNHYQTMTRAFNETFCSGHSLSQLLSFFMTTSITNHYQAMIKAFNKTFCSGHNLNQLLNSIVFQFFMTTSITNHFQASNKHSLPATFWFHNVLENFILILNKSLNDV